MNFYHKLLTEKLYFSTFRFLPEESWDIEKHGLKMKNKGAQLDWSNSRFFMDLPASKAQRGPIGSTCGTSPLLDWRHLPMVRFQGVVA